MGGPIHNHKRSWKNLLLNRGYQLRFTLFMVGLSAVLMGGLGWWVLRVARQTTQVAWAQVLGQCDGVAAVAMPLSATLPGPASETTPTAETAETDKRRRAVVVESEMQILATKPAIEDREKKLAAELAIREREKCRAEQVAKMARLEHDERMLTWAMGGTGLLLLFGLFAYGIKMTHKVAGPLYKIGLYLEQLRDGRYKEVYNLRKGDQLVSFYEHFKEAHRGVRRLQEEDIAELGALLAVAQTEGAPLSPELKELEIMLRDKEKSIVDGPG